MSSAGVYLPPSYTQGKRFPDTMGQVRSTLGAIYPEAFNSFMMPHHTKVWSYLADCRSDDTSKMNQDSKGITVENFNILNSDVTHKDNNTKEESHSALYVRRAEKSNADTTDGSCLLEFDLQRHIGRNKDTMNMKKNNSDDIPDSSGDLASYFIVSNSDVASESTDSMIQDKTNSMRDSVKNISDFCHKTWSNMSNQVNCRKETMDSGIPRKRSKQRRKVIAFGRGRGRARCQLRRSGVSQARHRKKHVNREFAVTNHRVDQELSNSDDYDVEFVPLIRATNPVPSNSSSVSTTIPVKQNQRQKQKMTTRSDLLEQLDSSVDSEDSFCIVFTSEPEEDEVDGCYEKPENKETSESFIDFEDNVCIVYTPDLNETESDQEDESDEYDTNEIQKKKVRFDPDPVVHIMVKWNYAYRAARKGPWEEMARDNARFKGRIKSIGAVLNPILTSKHRSEIWQERFAP